MCGRFTLTEVDIATLAEHFALDAVPADLPPRYNIAPTQPVATVVREAGRDTNTLVVMRWGLIPSWAKDTSGAGRLINARAETAAEKPSFRAALNKRRCLIIADGFYEWQAREQGPKQPLYITLGDHRVFGMAGLWERWTEPDSGASLTTCTILTTAPNALMAAIHNRMPVILPPEAYADWLDPAQTEGRALLPLLRPYPADQMSAYPVSHRVNNPAYDAPDLIARAD